MNRKVVSEIIALLYVCLMLYTAIAKLKDYNITREQMAMMPLLTSSAHIIVWLLPAIEIVIALLLFIPKFRVIGLYFVTVLMVLFCIYIVYMMNFHEHLPCSCGGLLESLSWTGHLIFNSIFILLGAWAAYLLRVRRSSKKDNILVVRH